MSEKSCENHVSVSDGFSGLWIAIALLIIAFGGEPDLVGAIIDSLRREP